MLEYIMVIHLEHLLRTRELRIGELLLQRKVGGKDSEVLCYAIAMVLLVSLMNKTEDHEQIG